MSEVRLIDANALEKLFEEECTGECPVCGYSNEGCPCGLIKTAPTITPDMAQVLAYESGKASADRPTGEWKFMYKVFGIRFYKCTNCGTPQDLNEKQHIELFHYCTNCGAKMKQEAEDE